MNVKKRGKRIFGACVLLVMAVLAVCTVAFATESDTRDSYSLVIEKKFDADTPEEVLAEAKKQTYTFRIEGTVGGKGDEAPYSEKITLSAADGWRSKPINFGKPYNLTVTELTDDIEIKVGEGDAAEYYNMSDSSTDAVISVNSRKHELQLRNNSKLTIIRPSQENDESGPERLWYRVTNRPYDEHSSVSDPMDTVFSLEAGEKKEFTKLCAAIYTIEQIAAPDGYQIQMGDRNETVEAGKTGHFHINGTPGTLTLTAGGSKGDGVTHYYTVDRTEKEQEDTSEFVVRTVPVASGETYRLDNLPKGGYTVTEYTIDASEASKMVIAETKERTMNGKSSGLTTSETGSNWKYFSLGDENFDVDYIKVVSFGPLYNSKGNSLNSTTSYGAFRYGFLSDDAKKYINIRTYSNGGNGFKGDIPVTISEAKKIQISNFKYKRLYCTTRGLKSSTAKTIGVSWIEYDEKETEKTFKSVGQTESVTVDDRKWIKIEAPALNNPNAAGADQIAYYYTLKGKDGNLIQGTTDREGTTVKLRPGEATELTLPAAGTYTVTETIAGNTPVGFTMNISGSPFGTTEAGKEIEVKVGGRRTITISKPALGVHPAGSSDDREYKFRVYGVGVDETISVRAGESGTVTLPDQEGIYKISPQNDKIGNYKLNYTDSGAVYGTASGSTSTVTFTNSFSGGSYGYRFIHEYYVRDEQADGSYTYTREGESTITTRLGREGTEHYQALDIQQVPQYEGNTYKHFEEAYGWVDGIQSKTEAQMDMKKEHREGYNNTRYFTASSSTAQRIPDDDYDEEYDPEPPVASSSTARRIPDDGSDEEDGPEYFAASSVRRARDDGSDGEYDIEYFIASSSTAQRIPDDGSGEIYDIDFIIASSSTAQKAPADGSDKKSNIEHPAASAASARANLNSEALMADFDGQYSYDDRGIISKGVGEDSKGNKLNYGPEPGWNQIDVTEDASQIIILRYYRDRKPKGNYNVIHVYYFRDGNGDRWEGTSGIRPQDNGELGIKYTGDDVDKEYSFRPEGAEKPYTYIWDGRPQYGVVDNTSDTGGYDPGKEEFAGNGKVYRPNNDWTSVEATEEGNQIIILRYYREPAKEGTYNIVHEYYFRETQKSQDGEEEGSQGGSSAQPSDGDTETGNEEGEDIPDRFTGTINRNDGYVYTFEGRTEIEQSGNVPLGEQFTAKEEDRKYQYNNTQYTYLDTGYGTTPDHKNYTSNPNQQWAASTENGNEVIILRYYREDGKPEKPASGSYKVVHTYYFRDSSGRDHFEGRSAVSTVGASLDGRTYDADSVTKILTCEANNKVYVYDKSVYGYVTGDTANDRPTVQDPGDTLYRAEPGMEWVVATENGDQIIILRYYRQVSGSSGGGGSDPGSDDPEDHTTRSTEPATETTPESGTDPATETLPDPERPELPDPNAPGSPDTVTIMEDGVPVTYVKVWDPETGEYRYIPENELPLWGIFLPKTGDTGRSSLWGLLTISSLILLWGMWFFKSREREDS